jgi:ribosome-associated protein
MISITPDITLNERELQWEFLHASGPGGQNVNKVATAVQLRFDVLRSRSLPDDVRARLLALPGRRITRTGVMVIIARRFRSQEQNRRDARDRLIAYIHRAAQKPKSRKKTIPTRASRLHRLASKTRRARTKCLRQPVASRED